MNTPLVVSLLRRGNFVYTLFQSSSSFLIMNNEHIERTMNFIVQQQARTTEILTRATEAVAQTAEAITQLANPDVHGATPSPGCGHNNRLEYGHFDRYRDAYQHVARRSPLVGRRPRSAQAQLCPQPHRAHQSSYQDGMIAVCPYR